MSSDQDFTAGMFGSQQTCLGSLKLGAQLTDRRPAIPSRGGGGGGKAPTAFPFFMPKRRDQSRPKTVVIRLSRKS